MPKRKSGGKKKRQSGKGVKEVAKAVHKVIKDNQLVSKALGIIPHPAAQALAWGTRQAGYGVRQGQHGSGIFSDIGSGLGSLAYGVGGGLGSLAGGLFGRGKPQLTVVARPGLMQPVLKGL